MSYGLVKIPKKNETMQKYSNIESFEVPFLYYIDRKFVSKKTSQLWGALTVPQGSFFSHRLRALWSLKKGGGLLSHQQGAKVCQHLAICHSQPLIFYMAKENRTWKIWNSCWLSIVDGVACRVQIFPKQSWSKQPFGLRCCRCLRPLLWTRSSQAGNTQLTHASRKAKRRSAQPPASLQAVVFSHGSLTANTCMDHHLDKAALQWIEADNINTVQYKQIKYIMK